MYKTGSCPWTLSSEGSARKRARTELAWYKRWPGANRLLGHTSQRDCITKFTANDEPNARSSLYVAVCAWLRAHVCVCVKTVSKKHTGRNTARAPTRRKQRV